MYQYLWFFAMYFYSKWHWFQVVWLNLQEFAKMVYLCVYVWKHHGNNLTHYDLDPWPNPFQHRTDFMIWTKLIHWIFTINYILIGFFFQITLPLSGLMMLWRIKKSSTMAALLGLKESWTISSGSWNKCHRVNFRALSNKCQQVWNRTAPYG